MISKAQLIADTATVATWLTDKQGPNVVVVVADPNDIFRTRSEPYSRDFDARVGSPHWCLSHVPIKEDLVRRVEDQLRAAETAPNLPLYLFFYQGRLAAHATGYLDPNALVEVTHYIATLGGEEPPVDEPSRVPKYIVDGTLVAYQRERALEAIQDATRPRSMLGALWRWLWGRHDRAD